MDGLEHEDLLKQMTHGFDLTNSFWHLNFTMNFQDSQFSELAESAELIRLFTSQITVLAFETLTLSKKWFKKY